MMTDDEVKMGILMMPHRRFGTVAEMFVRKLHDLNGPKSNLHDLHEDSIHKRIEVKFSRVQRGYDSPVTRENAVAAIAESANARHRFLPYAEATTAKFDSNIQQIKRNAFDLLVYGLFFYDRILVFGALSEEVAQIPGYSDFQHRGNKGEGQFHINNKTLPYHMERRLMSVHGYDHLMSLLGGETMEDSSKPNLKQKRAACKDLEELKQGVDTLFYTGSDLDLSLFTVGELDLLAQAATKLSAFIKIMEGKT
jgi:hypothetical protein